MSKKRFILWFGLFIEMGMLTVVLAANIYSTRFKALSNAALPNVLNLVDNTTGTMHQADSQADEEEWCLILVNKEHYIPKDYEVELLELSNGQCVDRRIYPALQEMFDMARKDGVYPVVASGYRTAEKQQSLMDEKIAAYMAEGYTVKEAESKAEIWVAAVGTSEHQLGISVDINADGVHSTGSQVYEWLDKNSYKYGFIKRYPEDKTEITGIINEPWHYRYVGRKAAAEIYHSGVCLEEYLNGLAQSK